MSLRVLVLEDEPPALERIRALLAEATPDATIAGTADSVRAASDWLARHPAPDLILADIQLSDGLSLDLFRAQPPPCPVIFTTAHDDYLLDAFATHGIAYLLKPVKTADLAAALKKNRDLGRHYVANFSALAGQLASGAHSGESFPSATPRRRILAQKGLAFQPVAVEDAAYFFSEHKLTFLVTHKAERFLVNESLATLEAELAPAEFFRLGRNVLANIRAIRSFRSIGKGRLAVQLQPPTAAEVQVTQERAADFRGWAGGGR
jgi:two-component system, LytTR family, response regulator